MAVAELTGSIADFANGGSVEETDALDALMNGVAVGAGIAIDRAPHPARNSGHGLDAAQTRRDGRVDQLLQHRTRRHAHGGSLEFNGPAGVTQHDTGEAVIAHDQIGAAADHGVWLAVFADGLNRPRQRRFARSIGQPARRSSDPEAGVVAQGSAFDDL